MLKQTDKGIQAVKDIERGRGAREHMIFLL